jgi:hypothetical protein
MAFERSGWLREYPRLAAQTLEVPMSLFQNPPTMPNRLNLVFPDSFTSVDIGPEPTYGEVARTLRHAHGSRDQSPTAIKLVLGQSYRSPQPFETI